MSFDGFCPACSHEIPSSGFSTGNAVCACGWSDPAPFERLETQTQKRTVGIMAATAIVIALGFIHLASWGSHAFTVPGIWVQEATGTLSKAGYRQYAKICESLNKWDCAREAYLGMQQVSRDGEGLVLLARLQAKLKQNQAAMTTLATYFRLGGRDGEAALQLAKLLDRSGDDASAIKYYESSIELRPEVLPVVATSGIVRILIKQGRYSEAHQRIIEFHASAGNAKGYLNTELENLEAALLSRGITPRKGKNLAFR